MKICRFVFVARLKGVCSMPETFFVVISLLAVGYAFFTKQVKLGLGLLVLTITFALMIPNLSYGIRTDFLNAIALVVFIIGIFVIVWKKPVKKIEEPESEIENEENKDNS